MKKGGLFLIFLLSLVGCKSYWVNNFFKYNGIYDDKQKLVTHHYKDKTIVFLPMHHVGTEDFYNDVKYKIDSLKNSGYYFLYERVDVHGKNDTDIRKMRKIFRNPLTKPDFGYKNQFDSIFPNFKYKKTLIDQPSYELLGLIPENSTKADANLQDVISYYENKYGEIKLTNCDFKTSVFEKYTKCREENRIPKKQSDDVLINFRNDVVANKIKESSHTKIAIIYGRTHMDGILKALSDESH